VNSNNNNSISGTAKPKQQKQDDDKKKTTTGLFFGWNTRAITNVTSPPVQASAEPTQENHPMISTSKYGDNKEKINNMTSRDDRAAVAKSSSSPPLVGGLFGGWILLVVIGVLSIMASYLYGSFRSGILCGPIPMHSRLTASSHATTTTTTTIITTAVAPWWAPDNYKQLAFNMVCNSNDRPRTRLEWNSNEGKLTIWELAKKKSVNSDDDDKLKVLVTKKKLESVLVVHGGSSSNKDDPDQKNSQSTVMLTLSKRGGGKVETIAAPWGKLVR
jgi:hypothetical protein